MVNHTKGPFKAYVEDGVKGPKWSAFDESNSIAIAEPHGHIVARVCIDAMSSPGDPTGRLAAKANLALFTAAPEILAALDGLSRACRKRIVQDGDDEQVAARAAIAKARSNAVQPASQPIEEAPSAWLKNTVIAKALREYCSDMRHFDLQSDREEVLAWAREFEARAKAGEGSKET